MAAYGETRTRGRLYLGLAGLLLAGGLLWIVASGPQPAGTVFGLFLTVLLVGLPAHRGLVLIAGRGRRQTTRGYSLLGWAAALAVLGVLWLAIAGVEPGGAVLGLLLLFVLTGPIAFAGWRVLQD